MKLTKRLILSELEKLSTKRLLAYKNKLYSTTWKHSHDGFGCDDCMEEWKAINDIYDQINLVKSVLSTREHMFEK